jgi:hypothetical protein
LSESFRRKGEEEKRTLQAGAGRVRGFQREKLTAKRVLQPSLFGEGFLPKKKKCINALGRSINFSLGAAHPDMQSFYRLFAASRWNMFAPFTPFSDRA